MADYYGITLTFNDLNVLVQKTYYLGSPSFAGILHPPCGYAPESREIIDHRRCAASAAPSRLPPHRLR